jgi:tetratricopeptide (TPR) repeat protein
MLDMYSDGPIREARYRPGQDPLEVCAFFDRQPHHARSYRFYGHEGQWSYFGGARRRVFGGQAAGGDERYFYCLNKAPLFRYHPTVVVSDNVHWLAGIPFADESGCLLHFKYVATFSEQAREEAARQEHWNGAAQYAQYAAVLEKAADLSLYDPSSSVRYRDSRQLVELGLMGPAGPAEPDAVVSETAVTPGPGGPLTLTRQVRNLIHLYRTRGTHPHPIGTLAAREGRYEAAVAAFRDAITLAPDFPWAYEGLGDALAHLNRPEAAATAYRRALELNPHFARFHAGLGHALVEQERWEEAAAVYGRALEIDPSQHEAAHGLARALIHLARGAEAIRWLRRALTLAGVTDALLATALELEPGDPSLYLLLADGLVARNELARAMFLTELALRRDPEDPRPPLRLARLLRDTPDLQGALACARRAVALDPAGPEARDLLDGLLARLGQRENADQTDQARRVHWGTGPPG